MLNDQFPLFCYYSDISYGMCGCQASCQCSNCYNICFYGSFKVKKVSGSVYPLLVHFTPFIFLVCLSLPLPWGKVRHMTTFF